MLCQTIKQKQMRLNYQSDNLKELSYRNVGIVSYSEQWDEFDDDGKLVTKKQIICELHKDNTFHLNLGECSNGDKFNGVNHAINQAKQHIDICLYHKWYKD